MQHELRNVGILPQHYTASKPEDGGIMDLRNFGIIQQNYTASQLRSSQNISAVNALKLAFD
jgi:hypothetical protein